MQLDIDFRGGGLLGFRLLDPGLIREEDVATALLLVLPLPFLRHRPVEAAARSLLLRGEGCLQRHHGLRSNKFNKELTPVCMCV